MFIKVTVTFLTVILFKCAHNVGGQQNIVHSFGPVNITRAIGENNVYIPCSFSGQYNPLWSINQIYYEAHSLPGGMIAASYGLLIPKITEDMNGTTFQCFVSSDHATEIQQSSVGTLSVEDVPTDYREDFNYLPYYNEIQMINIDHQHTIFNEDSKIIAWKGRSINCNNYKITATTCDGMQINEWPRIGDENTISVPTRGLVHGNGSELLLLYLSSLNGEGEVCQTANQYIEIEQSDVTQMIKVSLNDGLCIDIIADSMIPYVVLPRYGNNITDTTDQQDCFCPVITKLNVEFDIETCNCIGETMFSESLYVSRVEKNPPTYEFCFRNLSLEMNKSVVHFFESLRYCKNKFDRSVDINFRRYHRSFQMLVVLANPPEIKFDNETGRVEFISTGNGEISLDYFQVIVRDSSDQAIFNKMLPNSANSTNIAKVIQQPICSPYTLSVRAHNTFGYSESNWTIGSVKGDPCMCIKQNVNIEMKLLDEDGVQFNCSQLLYDSFINLTLSANGQQNISATCNNGTQTVTFYRLSLDCGKSHELKSYFYTYTKEVECTVKRVISELPCQENRLYIILTITLGALSGMTMIILLIIMTCYFVKCCKRTNSMLILNDNVDKED